MATLTVTTSYAGYFLSNDAVYEDAQAAGASDNIGDTYTLIVGQSYSVSEYNIYRVALFFDLSSLPASANISAATLKLYATSDASDRDFFIYIMPHTCSNPIIPDDFDLVPVSGTNFGFSHTVSWTELAWHEITLNATGIASINAQLRSNVRLGLISDSDYMLTAPIGDEKMSIAGWTNTGYEPELEITYYEEWATGEYPNVPDFPDPGRIDLATYSIIRQYLTGYAAETARLEDGDDNIDLEADKAISWTGGEAIGWDADESEVTASSLEVTTAITLNGDFATQDLAIVTALNCVDSDITGNALLVDSAYNSIKAKVTDNEMIWAETVGSAPTPGSTEADIYMDDDSGDLRIRRTNIITKTDILADYSAM